jgi:hypothetical protein
LLVRADASTIHAPRSYIGNPLACFRECLICGDARATGGAVFDLGAKRIEPHLSHGVMLLKQTEAVANDFAGRSVAARVHLLLNEALEMGTQSEAGRHGQIPLKREISLYDIGVQALENSLNRKSRLAWHEAMLTC